MAIEASSEIIKEEYKAGDYVFFEGDIDFHFYIIEVGEIQIFTKNKDGKRIDLVTVKEGESFGEFALLSKQPRSASAQALTTCSLIKVSEKGYQELLADLPTWVSSMLQSLAGRMRTTTGLLQDSQQFVDYKKSEK